MRRFGRERIPPLLAGDVFDRRAGSPTAVDGDLGTRCVRGIVGKQVGDRSDQLLRATDTAIRIVGGECALFEADARRCSHGRQDHAGVNRVDPDLVAAEFDGGDLAQPRTPPHLAAP